MFINRKIQGFAERNFSDIMEHVIISLNSENKDINTLETILKEELEFRKHSNIVPLIMSDTDIITDFLLIRKEWLEKMKIEFL